ncbi:RNA polymerase sigma factor [Thalassotalea agariperforans]
MKDKELEAFWPRLARIATSYEAIPQLQEELQQEMAIAIWQAMDRYRGESSLSTFLYKICHNVAVGHIKKQMKQIKTLSQNDDISTSRSLAQDFSQKQELNCLLTAIRQLPLIQRQLITLYLDGVKQQDIAEIMGISENNVAVSINRAKKSLQQIMTKNSTENTQRSIEHE